MRQQESPKEVGCSRPSSPCPWNAPEVGLDDAAMGPEQRVLLTFLGLLEVIWGYQHQQWGGWFPSLLLWSSLCPATGDRPHPRRVSILCHAHGQAQNQRNVPTPSARKLWEKGIWSTGNPRGVEIPRAESSAQLHHDLKGSGSKEPVNRAHGARWTSSLEHASLPWSI